MLKSFRIMVAVVLLLISAQLSAFAVTLDPVITLLPTYTKNYNKDATPNEQLLWASYNGDVGAAALAIKNGACVDSRDQYKNTPLMLSAYNGHTAIVGFLVKFYAETEFANNWGNTALMLASVNGKAEAADILVNDALARKNRRNCKNGYTSLMWASEFGHVDVMKILLQHKCGINKRNFHRETALMVAAANGKKEAVEFLINTGAKLNRKNKTGMTALKLAEEKGYTEIAEILKKAGAH